MNLYSDTLAQMYLDYFNNYITLAKFAEINDLTKEEGLMLISLGRKIHERQGIEKDLKRTCKIRSQRKED